MPQAAPPSEGGGPNGRAPGYARVIVDVRPAHLDHPFDYRIPEGATVGIGQRVRVAFAGRRRTGWVVDLADEPETDPARVRDLALVQGETRWFDRDDLRFYRWVADRWAGTLADVLRHAVPARVAAVDREAAEWPAPPPCTPSRPPPAAAWEAYGAESLLAAADAPDESGAPAFWWRPLADADPAGAVAELAARTLAAGRGVLVIAPEPNAPALDAVAGLDPDRTVDWRAAQGPRSRHRAFLRGRTGHARVAVGERGAVFAPVAELGLVIALDEANPAYKEHRSPRFHARDVALARARFAGVPAVVTGDLPSAALWRLLGDGHVAELRAPRAVETDRAPAVEVIDLADPRPRPRARLSSVADRALARTVGEGGAALVLATRRGEGTALACSGCGERLVCPVCAGSLAAHGSGRGCPTCGWTGSAEPCRRCGDTRTAPLAAGAERLAAELGRAHPAAEVVALEGYDAPGPTERPAIAVATRGAIVDRPGWLGSDRATVLVVPDADALRGRADLEAGEDALRLWMDAARLADHIVLQTREPRAAGVQALVRWDPDGFWRREERWRAELGFPPARTLVRVEAGRHAELVGEQLREALAGIADVLGPDPGGALLVKTARLRGTLRALVPLRAAWGRDDLGVRVDVDPVPAG
ncbi:hypothetical protein ER308_19545 [Egibacter rhizosphaerae]|uniref:Primosomal protein N' 3' DNA-binding domain-containing protein n=1 Tax=Egibacter rhizosphaerae TaxID=1670831 RepID=A0A411YK26_9ACTN|nr:hypothetical protein [Egibacter rhizosphaerae]QBI21545.1 hypothetical protein ER308_19545 [Egibacter rhizosphaerae]